MSQPTVSSRAIRGAAVLGALVVGGGVVQPWVYVDRYGRVTTDPTQVSDVVLGVETVVGAVALGLVVLGVSLVLRSWTLRSALGTTLLGALIGLFGLTGAVAPPPEVTAGPLFVVGGGMFLAAGGLVGVVERVRSGDRETIPFSSVTIAGGVLVAVSPFFGHAVCFILYPCYYSRQWVGSDFIYVPTFALFASVLLLTRRWNPRTQLLTALLGSIAVLVGAFLSVVTTIPGMVAPLLTELLFPYVATVGSVLVLLGSLLGPVEISVGQ